MLHPQRSCLDFVNCGCRMHPKFAHEILETSEIDPGTHSYGIRDSCAGREGSRRVWVLHRSEPRCSQLNDETILKREFMRISACEFQLTRPSQSID